MSYRQLKIVIWLCLQTLISCTSDSSTSGAGGQTTNGVTVSIVYPDGKPGSNLTFRVRPVDYLTEFSDSKNDSEQTIVNGITDSSGVFNIDSLKNGSYIIEVNDGKGFAVAFEHNTLNSVGVINTLAPTGVVSGYIPSDELNSKLCYVQIYGLERISIVQQNGNFVFTDVPAGSYNFRQVLSDSTDISLDIRNIMVYSNDTTILPTYPQWQFNTKLTLNTSVSGANVQGDVHNFPVLIRLSSVNFDFSRAKANGEDIRFTKADGMGIPFEIERWDMVNKQAEIWVKIDTVHGNDSKQSITIHWGNADAETQSNSSAVFDTAYGFCGVWHLNETSGILATDATSNGLTGNYAGNLPKNEKGPSGICQDIAHSDSDYIDFGNVLDMGVENISISIWFKRTKLFTPQALVAKTNGDYPSVSYGYLLSIDPGHFLHFNMASGGSLWGDDGSFDISSNLAVTDSTNWHHAFVVIDRTDINNCKMYVDGVDWTCCSKGNVISVGSVTNSLSLRIATENDNNASFNGAIDEVRISSTVRSADWVKLSYMNQKNPDVLVNW